MKSNNLILFQNKLFFIIINFVLIFFLSQKSFAQKYAITGFTHTNASKAVGSPDGVSLELSAAAGSTVVLDMGKILPISTVIGIVCNKPSATAVTLSVSASSDNITFGAASSVTVTTINPAFGINNYKLIANARYLKITSTTSPNIDAAIDLGRTFSLIAGALSGHTIDFDLWSGSSWVAKSVTGLYVNDDYSLVYDGTDIFALNSGFYGTNLFKYNLSTDTWSTVMTSANFASQFTPDISAYDCSLVYDGQKIYMMFIGGNNSLLPDVRFASYDKATNTITELAPPFQNTTPLGEIEELALSFDGKNIYALTSYPSITTSNSVDPKAFLKFHRYNVSTNTWTELSVPGSSEFKPWHLEMTTDGTYLYAFKSGLTQRSPQLTYSSFYKYDPNNDTWTSLSSPEIAPTFSIKGDLVFDGVNIYRRAINTASAPPYTIVNKKYNINTDTWTTLPGIAETSNGYYAVSLLNTSLIPLTICGIATIIKQ